MTLRLRMMALVPVLLATAATPAHALTLKEAQARAIDESNKVKGVKTGATPAVLYGTDHVVKAGSQVWWTAGPALLHKKKDQRPVVTPAALKKDTWVFWLDPSWGAKGFHRTVVFLIADTDKRSVSARATPFWPVIDGELPPYVTWGRFDPRFQVMSTVPSSSKQQLGSIGTAPLAAAASRPRTVLPIRAPKDSLAGACIITIGEANVIKANADFLSVLNLGKDLAAAGTGLKTFRAAGGKEFPEMPTGEDLHDDIGWMIRTQACREVLLYINGHAVPSNAQLTPKPILVGSSDWKTSGKNQKGVQTWQQSTAWVTGADITGIFKDFGSTHFDLVIDAAGSGRYWSLLRNHKQYSNVHVGAFSSRVNELSYLYLSQASSKRFFISKSDTDNPGNIGKPGRGEYTNGIVSSLRTFFSNEAALGNARAVPGASLFAQALTFGAAAEVYSDLAARVQLTRPLSFTDQKLMPDGTAPAKGAVRTLGSSLEPDVDTVLSSPEDEDFWNTLLNRFPATIPDDGQVLAIRIKGIVDRSFTAGAPPPLNEVHFVALRPQGDGTVQTIVSSQAFNIPYDGDVNQINEFKPENFCVKKGDYIGLSTEGGFDPTFFPQGAGFRVFAKVPTSQINSFTLHNGVMNGSRFTGTPTDETELLLQFDLGTGDQATALCPGGTRS